MTKSRYSIIVFLAAFFLACVTTYAQTPDSNKYHDTIRLTSNVLDPSSTYGRIINKLSKELSNRGIFVEEGKYMAGSVNNMDYVNTNKKSISICQGDVFRGHRTHQDLNVKILGSLYTEKLHLLYIEKSISQQLTISNIKNKKIYNLFTTNTLGGVGTGTRYTIYELIQALNRARIEEDTSKCTNVIKIKRDSTKVVDVIGNINGLCKGVDSINVVAFVSDNAIDRIKAVQNCNNITGIKLIQIDSGFIRKYLPLYTVEYAEIGKDTITTIGTPALLIAHKDLPDELRGLVVDILNSFSKTKSNLPTINFSEDKSHTSTAKKNRLLDIQSVRLILFIMYLTCAWVLLLIWLRTRKEGVKMQKDWGLLFIALHLITISILNILKFSENTPAAEFHLHSKSLSTLGNACLLISLPYFTHAFNKIKEKYKFSENHLKWMVVILIFNIFIIFIIQIYGDAQYNEYKNIYQPYRTHDKLTEFPALQNITRFDVLYNFIIISFFFIAIYKSFNRRGYGFLFKITSFLIWLCFSISIASFLDWKNIGDVRMVLYIFCQIAFIILVLVLAQSWAVEAKETAKNEEIKDLKIKYEKKTNTKGVEIGNLKSTIEGGAGMKTQYQGNAIKFYKKEIQLIMPNKNIEVKIPLERLIIPYKNLLIFALSKKAGTKIEKKLSVYKDDHNELDGSEMSKITYDIRMWLNKHIETQKISTKELIIKTPESNVYELDCTPENIEIDTEALSKYGDLEKIKIILNKDNAQE